MTRRGGGVSSPFAVPCKDAREADVFWCAEFCPSVLSVHASPADDPHAYESFFLSELTCRVVALVAPDGPVYLLFRDGRSEEHTSELQSLMRISYAVFCLKKQNSYECKKQ